MNMFISVISEAFIFYHASVWAVSQSVSWGQIATYWFASIDDTCLAPTRGFSPPSCKTSKNHHRQTSEHLGDDSPHSFQFLEYLAAALVGRLSRMRCDWIGCQIFFFFSRGEICKSVTICPSVRVYTVQYVDYVAWLFLHPELVLSLFITSTED